MNPVARGTARVRISETGEVLSASPAELEWEQNGADERSMGTELRYVAEHEFVSRSTGESLFVKWELWEYPIGVQNHNQTSTPAGVELLQDFEIFLEHVNEED